MIDRTKNPSSILYWNDLENDAELKTCSLAAKGLWAVHMLAIAAKSPEPGVVIVGAHPSILGRDLEVVLARAVGAMPDEVAECLRELVDSGAASVDERGRIINRRMVREAHERAQKSAAGKKGMEARWGKRTNSTPDNRTITEGVSGGITERSAVDRQQTLELQGENGPSRQDPGYQTDNGNITSSLLHDSKTPKSRENLTVERGARLTRAKAEPGTNATRLPDGWRPEGALRQWTLDEIAKRQSTVSAGHELEKFTDHFKAAPGVKGRKSDWPATWRNWIRGAFERENNGNGIYRQGARPQERRRTGAQNAAAFAAAFGRPRDRGPADDDGGT